MYTPRPATIESDIHDKLNAELLRSSGYMSAQSLAFTRLYDDLNVLGKVDGAARSVHMAVLYTICGDREQAEYYLNNAMRLHATHVDVELSRLIMLLNLGYFSESLPVMRALGQREIGGAPLIIVHPPSNGAAHTINSFFDQARDMNIQNLPIEPTGTRAAAEIMDQWGDTDEDYTFALDFAGEIMRERSLIFQEDIVTLPVPNPPDGSAGYVKLSFKVAVDLGTSIDMTCDYVDRLAKSGRKIPPSLIFEFEGTK